MSRSYGDRKDRSDKLMLLKEKVKHLDRENSRLRKELNKALGELAAAHNSIEEKIDEDRGRKRKKADICDGCGKGAYVSAKLTIRGETRVYLTCNTCGQRKTLK